jgi:hypothetical protein
MEHPYSGKTPDNRIGRDAFILLRKHKIGDVILGYFGKIIYVTPG